MLKTTVRFLLLLIIAMYFFSCSEADDTRTIAMVTIKDSMNREIKVPQAVNKIICSGAGALRYITYIQCQDRVIAVDDREKVRSQLDARPYSLANPQFIELPLFGEFRGNDNPELIAALSPQPDLIFKTYAQMGYNPLELQEKTGIPVLVMDYGDLVKNRPAFYNSLDLIGRVMKKEERAAAIKEYINEIIADLDSRTKNIQQRPICYIGGIAYKGPLGLQSTEPGYPPFVFLNTPNAAFTLKNNNLAHMDVSKEKIVEWDPKIIFIDLATIESGAEASALYELKTDPAYSSLQAVNSGHIYGVLPYNWYTQNHGSTLANAYYIGKLLYPERFTDIDPIDKADEIYSFLVGKAVFKQLNESFNNMVYTNLEL